MDAPAFSGIQLSPQKDFDQILEIRAQKHQHLRGRNNVTSCRSPTREFDTKQIKNELKEKRHQEFLRRRSVSPELIKSVNDSSKSKYSAKTCQCHGNLMKHRSSSSKLETLHTNVKSTLTTNGYPVMISTQNSSKLDAPITSQWAPTITLTQELHQHKSRSRDQRQDEINEKTLREAGMQTESGLITVKESDILQLHDYLQEALWREEAMKKKLAALQESVSNLINSSNKIRTARFSEDLLKNKIKGLEAQLQACLQKFAKDGLKKQAVQMEKQKLIYEEKALAALQKATQEKTEALVKAETLQVSLNSARTEGQRLHSLYEDLKISSENLHSQLELSRAREAKLMEKVSSLEHEEEKLEYRISLLVKDNHILREEIQQLRDSSNERQDFKMQTGLTSEEVEKHLTVKETPRWKNSSATLRRNSDSRRESVRSCRRSCMPWSRSVSPARPVCRSAGMNSGNSPTATGEQRCVAPGGKCLCSSSYSSLWWGLSCCGCGILLSGSKLKTCTQI
ncbi:hypothetical protein Q5P01_007574 [Channa striata]|uniref:Uncharacterized protein n=1 Tax=Channa striata TaxID=64152 RepID=A0AA88N515_CHASR|nr:hypothetical protein Q5P01_007574 [Channa striata]